MKTFNEKLDDLLTDMQVGESGCTPQDETLKNIVYLICETVKEAKPKTHYITYIGSSTITRSSTENALYNAGCDQYQDNLINIVRGK